MKRSYMYILQGSCIKRRPLYSMFRIYVPIAAYIIIWNKRRMYVAILCHITTSGIRNLWLFPMKFLYTNDLKTRITTRDHIFS